MISLVKVTEVKEAEGQFFKVQLRGGFADRHNVHPVNTTMQYDELDDRSRVALVNEINELYHIVFDNVYDHQWKNIFWRKILVNVYSQQVEYAFEAALYEGKMFEIINSSIYEDDYANVLSVVEYVAGLLQEVVDMHHLPTNVMKRLNQTLEREFVGYRFVDKYIVQITNDVEIRQIQEAISIKNNKVNEHIEKALSLISDRENPDYENSIKESISSVEAMCNSITGKKTTLGEALKLLKKGTSIHPSLEAAFEKLYGYTNDASGIRHAGQIDGEKATFEEAKFMIVACSGFVNYLKGICGKQ